MNNRLLLILWMLFVPLASMADDASIYESFSGVTIGRVFLSQQERELLDRRRLTAPQGDGAVSDKSSASAATSKSLQSAGYIIGHDGRSKVWRDGEFIESRQRAASTMSFPGDVKITRHAIADKPAAADADVGGKSGSGSDDD